MALVVNDRVKETSTTTGTGLFTLAGAVTGFETFSSAIGNTNTTYYAIVNTTDGEFEVGLGTVGAGTLSRDTIISSSNSDAAVDFAAGTKNVFCTLPASKSVILDASGNIVANNGSNLTNLNADNLASGTLPDARFPATLPASNGSALTNLNASNVASGTLASDRLPTVPTTKGGTGLTAIGTANQVLAVNSGGTALEYQTISADITGVTAGNGLTGGGTTGDVTLNVGAGALIDVTADAIDVDLSELTTSTSDADGDFFVVVDSVNAQKKLTKANIAISGFNNDSGFIDGSSLNASNLSSGTVPDARFPATLPAISGANLTNLDADDLASGTLPDARFPATLPAASGANLTSLNATNIASGTLASDRLPTVPTTKGGTGLTTIGSANQVLAVNGAGTALEYQTPTTGDITGVTAGTGLSGGGSSGDVTLDLDLNELTTSTADADGDFFAVVDSVGAQKKLTKGNIAISGFNNDSGFIDGSSLNASNLSSGTVPDARFPATLPAISGANLTNLDASDLASGTVPNARLSAIPNTALANSAITINGTSTALGGSINVGDITGVTAGTLLDGGGTTGDVTLNVDLSELTTSTSDADGDFFVVVDSVNAQKKLTKANINISGFNNDSGFTTNTGTVTSVSGGDGLTGSVTTSGSLAVGAGTLIDVTADAVNVDLSELATSTSDADGDFFVVVDSVNAQKKLTKANINISGFNNDAGYSTTTGTVTSVGVTAGVGLSGGGTITTSGTVTLTVDLSELTDMTVPMVGTDEFIVLDAGADRRKAANEIGLSIFNNDSGFTTNTGTVTSVGVTAGSGLTGGGTVTSSGTVTLDVGAGTGIDVAADSISVDVSDFMTNGSNNRVVTATGTDGMNAEANMTFDGSTLTVTGAVVPGANDTYDLGSALAVWRNVYTGDLHLSNEAKEEGNAVDGTKGNWTIQEGAEHLYILNNKNGKKYKFKLEEM